MRERKDRRMKRIDTAALMFTEVSRTYSASVNFQGIAIAKLCAERNLNPLLLRAALLGDPDRLEMLTTTANAVHAASTEAGGKKKSIEVITVEKLEEVVETSFWIANRAMVIPQEHKVAFLKFYPKFRELAQSFDLNALEDELEGIVNSMISSYSSPPTTV